MTREEILDAYRRFARKSPDGPPGIAAFVREFRRHGITDHEFRSGHWRSWRAFQDEAGVTPNQKTARLPDELVLAALASLARKLQRVPGDDDLAFERRRDPSVPSVGVIRARARTLSDRAAVLRSYCDAHPGWEDVRSYASATAPEAAVDPDPASTVTSTGYVYMVKYGRYYKVGWTGAIDRRTREIQLHLPDRQELVHHIETDDPSGIEAYWHRRFSDKRHRGEWFALTADDVRAFRRRSFM